MYYDIIAFVFIVSAVVMAIAATMRASAKYDAIDYKDIETYNIKEMWFLVWDHREEYGPALGALLVVLIAVVLG